MSISQAIRRFVRTRAGDACEYCRLPQRASIVPHQVDHVIAVQHGRSDQAENLCLACIRCNLHKGPNVAGVEDGQVVPLFNPRQQRWEVHFLPDDRGKIHGLTPEGRVTVRVLDMNNPERVRLREALLREG